MKAENGLFSPVLCFVPRKQTSSYLSCLSVTPTSHVLLVQRQAIGHTGFVLSFFLSLLPRFHTLSSLSCPLHLPSLHPFPCSPSSFHPLLFSSHSHPSNNIDTRKPFLFLLLLLPHTLLLLLSLFLLTLPPFFSVSHLSLRLPSVPFRPLSSIVVLYLSSFSLLFSPSLVFLAFRPDPGTHPLHSLSLSLSFLTLLHPL